MKQFDNITTFFDLGFDSYNDNFICAEYCAGGYNKKRASANKLIWQRLLGLEMPEDDMITADKYLTGTAYSEIKNKIEAHCQLCSQRYNKALPLINHSKTCKFWDICEPTSPYTPSGLMIYLKKRQERLVENIDDLTLNELEEIEQLAKNTLTKLSSFSKDVCGINILFHQISVSQACLHGHLEIMFKEPHTESIGCSINFDRPFDLCTAYLNQKVESMNEHILLFKEGVKIDTSKVPLENVLSLIKKYRENTLELTNFINKLRIEYTKEREGSILKQIMSLGFTEKESSELLFNISPAPINYVYFTYYRNKFYISIVPEIVLKRVSLEEIKDNEYQLYNLKFNAEQITSNKSFLEERHPLVRPSIKLTKNMECDKKIEEIKQNIFRILEGNIK